MARRFLRFSLNTISALEGRERQRSTVPRGCAKYFLSACFGTSHSAANKGANNHSFWAISDLLTGSGMFSAKSLI